MFIENLLDRQLGIQGIENRKRNDNKYWQGIKAYRNTFVEKRNMQVL
jgi:hypothetical protein